MAGVIVANPGDMLQSRIVQWQSSDNQLSINTAHWLVFAYGGPVQHMQDLAIALDTAVNGVYKAFMSNTATYRGVAFCRISPGARTTEEFTVANSGVGTVVASCLPQQTAGLIKKHSTVAGRHGRGRFYPGFPPTTFADTNGNMNGTGVTAITNLNNAYPTTIVIGGVNICGMVLHNRGVVGSQIPVSVLGPVLQFATQRRRGQLGRPNILPF